MKNIGFDAQPLFRARDGIGTYVAETIKHAAKLYPEWQFTGVYFSEDSLDLVNELKDINNINFVKSPFPWRAIRLFAELGIWLPLDKFMKLKFDGFLYLNFVSLPWVSNKVPKILLVHDAVYKHYPETVSKPNLYYLKKFVGKSAHRKKVSTFSVSRHAADDLNTLLGVEVNVGPPAPSINVSINQKESKGHLFFIGTIEPRKNIPALIDAYARLDEKIKKVHPLIVAGKVGWDAKEILSKLKNTPYVEYIGPVSEDQKNDLTSTMHALVMPSLYEGFGIPVLDAASIGKLVLTSANSPMEEICGDGAIYIDPFDVDSIHDGLVTLLNLSKSDRENKQLIAQQSASRYSWDNTARILLRSFEQ